MRLRNHMIQGKDPAWIQAGLARALLDHLIGAHE
jgi:hypothetical protein